MEHPEEEYPDDQEIARFPERHSPCCLRMSLDVYRSKEKNDRDPVRGQSCERHVNELRIRHLPRKSIEPVSDHCGEPKPDRNQNSSHCPLSPWGRSDPVGTAGLSGVDLTIHAPARFTGWTRFDADPSCREGPLSFPGSVRRRRGTARGAPRGRSFGARTECTSFPGMTGTRSRS